MRNNGPIKDDAVAEPEKKADAEKSDEEKKAEKEAEKAEKRAARKARREARAKARKANFDKMKGFEFMVFYFEGFRGLRWFFLSFFFFGDVASGGIVDSPLSVMSFLSFVRKVAILL